MTNISTSALFQKFEGLSQKHGLQDQPGLGAVLTLVEWFKETQDIRTVQEFIKEMNEKTVMLSKCMRYVEVTSAVHIFLRMLTKAPEELEMAEEFDACKKILLERSYRIFEYMKNVPKTIASLCEYLVARNTAILTLGHSVLVRELLFLAYDRRKVFTVVVARGGPHGEGARMVRELQEKGIKAVFVEDVAMHFYADKYRVKRIFLSAEAIYTNGASLCKMGTGLCVSLAKQLDLTAYILMESYKYQESWVFPNNDYIPDNVMYPVGMAPKERNVPHVELVKWKNHIKYCSDVTASSMAHMLELLSSLYI